MAHSTTCNSYYRSILLFESSPSSVVRSRSGTLEDSSIVAIVVQLAVFLDDKKSKLSCPSSFVSKSLYSCISATSRSAVSSTTRSSNTVFCLKIVWICQQDLRVDFQEGIWQVKILEEITRVCVFAVTNHIILILEP